MMIVPMDNPYSDDSEDGAVEIDIYIRKYQLLLERCEVLQQDNERLVNRIQQVKKLLRRSRRERKFFMDRLDQYGDGWRTVSLPVELDEPIDLPYVPSATKASKAAVSNSSAEKSKSKATGTKRKIAKAPADPNAPKRPANPFFQFCQEQRTNVLESLHSPGSVASTGGSEPTKQEVTKQLAIRWNMLTTTEKKIYYDMYEKSKERYAVDMHLYTMKKANAS